MILHKAIEILNKQLSVIAFWPRVGNTMVVPSLAISHYSFILVLNICCHFTHSTPESTQHHPRDHTKWDVSGDHVGRHTPRKLCWGTARLQGRFLWQYKSARLWGRVSSWVYKLHTDRKSSQQHILLNTSSCRERVRWWTSEWPGYCKHAGHEWVALLILFI